jgi:hypothetical protein
LSVVCVSRLSQAASAFDKFGSSQRALDLYLKSRTSEDIDKAIDLVGRARDQGMVNKLVGKLHSKRVKRWSTLETSEKMIYTRNE